MKITSKQYEKLSKHLQMCAIDKSAFGASIFKVEVNPPIERGIFWQAMAAEFGFQLKNSLTKKSNKFLLEFDWRKMPSDVHTRILERLMKIGHLEVK